MITKILVPTDGSDLSILAARYALYLATKIESKVTLLHVVEPSQLPFSMARLSDEKRQEIETIVEETGKSILRLTQKELVDASVPVDTIMRRGRPSDIICSVAEEGNYDLIIMGRTGHGGISRVLLGSVSQKVVHTAPCSVLIAKEREK